MKRAVWVALALGTMISGGAAIGVDTARAPLPQARSHAQRAAVMEAARNAQRAMIEARYQEDRARCDALAGSRKDSCLVDAHARKGRAMLEAAAPYSDRNS
jgi:hypothetical protein